MFPFRYGPARDAARRLGVVAATVAALLPAFLPRAANAQAYIGMNLLGVGDSQPDFLFADAFRTWRPGSNGQLQNGANLDGNGWPTQDFTALMWDGAFLPKTNGRYTLRFNGQADVNANAFGTLVSNSYDAATNTTTQVYDVSTGTKWLLFNNTKRTSTSAVGSGITNIRLMRPTFPGSTTSYADGTLFTTQIQDFCKKFKVIRYMDYQATNGNPQRVWADRCRPNFSLQGQNNRRENVGGALEHAVALANATDTDMWLCIPAQADDDYVRKVAQLVTYGSDGTNPYTSAQANPVYPPLKSNLRVYVEYSNELWNFAFGFSQSSWNVDQAERDVAAGVPLNFGGETNKFVWAWRRVGWRSAQQSKIFRSVVGDGNMMTRIRPVGEWQIGNGQGTGNSQIDMYKYIGQQEGRAVNWYIYGGGGSFYYSPGNDSSVSQIFATMPEAWENTAYQTDQDLCNANNIKRIAYEGGPSLDQNMGGNDPVRRLAMRDPANRGEVLANHQAWVNRGGDLVCYFSSSGTPDKTSWSFVDDIYAQDTAKMQGIADINAQYPGDGGTRPGGTPPPPTGGGPDGSPYGGTVRGIPGTIQAEDFNTGGQGTAYNDGDTTNNGGQYRASEGVDIESTTDAGGGFNVGWTTSGEWTKYAVNVTAAGSYNITLRAAANGGAATVRAEMNGATVATFSIPNTGGWQTFTSVVVNGVNLSAGNQTLRLVIVSGNPNINFVSFASAGGGTPGGGTTTAPVGKTIWLRARANNRAVCADGNFSTPGTLIANRDTVGPWERFVVEDAGNGTIRLKANYNGQYVGLGSGNTLIANKTQATAERFVWGAAGNYITLRASNNNYVCAENAGSSPLQASRATVGDWEQFTWGE